MGVAPLLAICMFLLTCQSFAQSRKPAPKTPIVKKSVTVKTARGETVQGKFLGATPEFVRIEDGADVRTISLDDVLSITFDRPRNDAKAREAIKAMRGLVSAVDIGVNYVEYSRRLIDTKIVVDAALTEMPDGKPKMAIIDALQFFEDALHYWRGEVQDGVGTLVLSDKHIAQLMLKYGAEVNRAVTPIPGLDNKRVSVKGLVSAVMTAAARKTAEAELSLNSQP